MQWLVNRCCGSIQPLRLHKRLLALIAAPWGALPRALWHNSVCIQGVLAKAHAERDGCKEQTNSKERERVARAEPTSRMSFLAKRRITVPA